MSRLVAVGNLAQAATLAGLAAWLAARFGLAAGVAGAAAGLQLGAAVAVLAGRRGLARWLSGGTVACGLLVAGLFAQTAAHMATAYGPDAARQGHWVLAGVVAGLPWVLGFPLWQWLAGRRPGAEAARGLGALALVGVGALAPTGARALVTAPEQRFPEHQAEAVQAAAEATHAAWLARAPAAATAPGDEGVEVALTPWLEGRPGATVRGTGPDLGAALERARARLPAPGPRAALVLDVAGERWPAGTPLPPSQAAVQGGRSPVTAVQSKQPTAAAWPLPEWRLPVVRADGDGPLLRVESWLVDADGARRLRNGWSAAPALDADQALAAAVAAGDMLLAHQDAQGRYAYVVKGPGGEEGPGYNYPRHAGATWFLARLAARTGEERFARAADRGLDMLAAASTRGPEGRAWVRDPRRKDGRAWAGTTALAAMGAAERRHPMAGAWGAFLAASVDPRGGVRGEVVEATGAFPDQPLNPYGQGQVTLALATLVRAGAEDLRPATERAGAFLDGGYAPLAAGHLVFLDEHWACLAASALHDVTGTAHGLDLCRGYLATSAGRTPVSGDPLATSTGAAGGLAEAVVAGAFLDPRGPHHARALAFGQHFLDSQYRAADAPLLPRPQALIGGFRDRPWELDVRMDAVQHVGCALLGVEELLRGERLPGSRP
ncbi:hypothetical protein L6R53_20350 [Myxococcota bacterium]|nr:hypothetical protein [Myxococcota bacterium]